MTQSLRPTEDPLDAFCTDTEAFLEGAASGPLVGLSFAAKDIFDVAGHVTGAGNPDWKATHGPAEQTARVVQMLVDAGATMVGKTHTDELTRGILGENPHYGTPVNSRAPGRVPGGSSSGSAAAVAGGMVDFALGSDTGGSVRIPASFCGLYGLRPTHGRIPVAGLLQQAASYDTIGWFTRDAATFARVGSVIFGAEITPGRPVKLTIAEDAFADADPRRCRSPAAGGRPDRRVDRKLNHSDPGPEWLRPLVGPTGRTPVAGGMDNSPGLDRPSQSEVQLSGRPTLRLRRRHHG